MRKARKIKKPVMKHTYRRASITKKKPPTASAIKARAVLARRRKAIREHKINDSRLSGGW